MQRRTAFTLVELLIVIAIIAIIAGMSMAALLGASEEGRRARARSQIEKIDQLISEKWNSYRFRQLPVRIPAGTVPKDAAGIRLNAIRELMRMEMPDRLTDITDGPRVLFAGTPDADGNDGPPWDYNINIYDGDARDNAALAVTRSYRRKAVGMTLTNEQAECLYLIISEIRDGDKSALEFFMNSEIGDTDGDGVYEILDPWGMPIRFLRWAPGYSIGSPDWSAPPFDQTPASLHPQYSPVTMQTTDESIHPDPFDPLKVDPGFPNGERPFLLRPLVFSAGPDKGYDIQNGYYRDDGTADFSYANTPRVPNDPYYIHIATGGPYVGKPLCWIGACHDIDGDGRLTYGDNITNHGLGLEGE